MKPCEPTLQIPSNDTEVERQHLGSAEALTVRGVELKEEERKKKPNWLSKERRRAEHLIEEIVSQTLSNYIQPKSLLNNRRAILG